jgi:hypothetical protein
MDMKDPDQPAPAVDPTGLLPNIIRDCTSEGDASRLALDAQFMNARFRAHQIVRLINFASAELHIALSARDVARVVEVGHSAVKHALLQGYDDPLAPGRHHELSADAQQQLADWIISKAANNVVVNRTEFLRECNERFGKSVIR